MDIAEGLEARWRALVATADQNLLSGLFPGDCDTEGSSRDGSDTCSGGASGTIAGTGIAFGGAPGGVRADIGVSGGSLRELGVGSGFDGGACFCGGA